MSKPVYVVVDPFLGLQRYVDGCTGVDDGAVKLGMAAVAAWPQRPKGYASKKLKPEGFYQVEVPLEEEILALTYEVRPLILEVRIAAVRERGAMRKVKDWLTGFLDDIAPKKD
jgi:hypothetical protein